MVIYSKVTEAPNSEPVTLAEARKHLNIDEDYTDDDAYITALIKVARGLCETYSGRSFLTQVRQIKLDSFPCYSSILNNNYFFRKKRYDGIIVPYGPVQSIDFIKYVDVDGVEQTLSADDYKADTHSDLARIFPSQAAGSWPSTSLDPNAITIEYTAGYDDVSGDYLPSEAKQAMLMQIGTLYENRQDEVIGTSVNGLCWNSKALLDNIKVYWNAEQG